MELTERTFKWPVSDPATDVPGSAAYRAKPETLCEAHIGWHQPMSARRDRRR